jgi:hypothetical protein
MTDRATLDEWKNRFSIVSSSDEVVNEELLRATESFKEMARNFKTPNKSGPRAADAELQEMLKYMETENL